MLYIGVDLGGTGIKAGVVNERGEILSKGSTPTMKERPYQAIIRDIAALGAAPGWNYSWSGGTAEKPSVMLWSKGTERLRATCTWGTTGGATDNLTMAVFAYSADGTTYDTIGTQTVAYDASGNVTSTTWS